MEHTSKVGPHAEKTPNRMVTFPEQRNRVEILLMHRKFFEGAAKTAPAGPEYAKILTSLVPRVKTALALSLLRYSWPKAGGLACLRSVSVVQVVLRPVCPRTRIATLRSAPTECDNLRRPTNRSPVFKCWSMSRFVWWNVAMSPIRALCRFSLTLNVSICNHRGNHNSPHDQLEWSFDWSWRGSPF